MINRKDFILNVINQLLETLKLITKLISGGKFGLAKDLIEKVERAHFGLEGAEIEKISDQTLFCFLKDNLKFEDEKIRIYIQLLFQKAILLKKTNEKVRSEKLFEKVKVLIDDYSDSTKTFNIELNQMLKQIN